MPRATCKRPTFDTLANDDDGMEADCDHPVRFGVVESVSTTINEGLRHGEVVDSVILL